MSTKPSLSIARRLKASPEIVFKAWTDPAKVRQWWGPDECAETIQAEIDLKVGGRLYIVTRTPNGEEHAVSGLYREVVTNEKLVFTWAWRSTPERQSLVTVLLQALDSDTLLTLTHEQFFDEAARDSHHAGWNKTLDKFAHHLNP